MIDGSDIGPLLRDTRSGFGWSLDDVAHRTRISTATLRQLEGNDYSKFPSPAYAKSFLTQYSEHLGLDLAEWLDTFETGNALSNLDSYEYLKDHTERINADPLVRKRDKPKKRRERADAEWPAGRSPSAALQPLFVFLVTALLVTGAVFGFMKLSDNLADESAAGAAKTPNEERLKPLSGISAARPDFRDLSSVPRALPVTSEQTLVAGDPGPSQGTKTLTTSPTTQVSAPNSNHRSEAAPPRAVIVEE